MKLNDLKCDFCDNKNKSALKSQAFDDLTTDHNNLNSSTSTVGDSSSASSGNADTAVKQLVSAKCLDCSTFMCSPCLADHQAISAFNGHQIISLNGSYELHDHNDESLR